MHFVFSYDLSADGQRRADIVAHVESLLSKYKNVKRLTTFYVVHIQSAEEWTSILKSMTDYSRSIEESFNFIMSPPISGGRYNGLLPANQWTEINEITQMQ